MKDVIEKSIVSLLIVKVFLWTFLTSARALPSDCLRPRTAYKTGAGELAGEFGFSKDGGQREAEELVQLALASGPKTALKHLEALNRFSPSGKEAEWVARALLRHRTPWRALVEAVRAKKKGHPHFYIVLGPLTLRQLKTLLRAANRHELAFHTHRIAGRLIVILALGTTDTKTDVARVDQDGAFELTRFQIADGHSHPIGDEAEPSEDDEEYASDIAKKSKTPSFIVSLNEEGELHASVYRRIKGRYRWKTFLQEPQAARQLEQLRFLNSPLADRAAKDGNIRFVDREFQEGEMPVLISWWEEAFSALDAQTRDRVEAIVQWKEEELNLKSGEKISGRSVIIPLKPPLSFEGRGLRAIRINGTGASLSRLLAPFGIGTSPATFTPPGSGPIMITGLPAEFFVDEQGHVFAQVKQLNPWGSHRLEAAKRKFFIGYYAHQAGNRVDVPLALAEYLGESGEFHGVPMAAVILGIEDSQDERLGDTFERPFERTNGHRSKREKLEEIALKAGRALRRLHDTGFVHRAANLDNLSYYQDEILLHDFETALENFDLSLEQKFGYRILDLVSIGSYMQAYDLSKAFLRGYFLDFDTPPTDIDFVALGRKLYVPTKTSRPVRKLVGRNFERAMNQILSRESRDGGARMPSDPQVIFWMRRLVTELVSNLADEPQAKREAVGKTLRMFANRKEIGELPSDKDFLRFKMMIDPLLGKTIQNLMSEYGFSEREKDEILTVFLDYGEDILLTHDSYSLARKVIDELSEEDQRKLVLLELVEGLEGVEEWQIKQLMLAQDPGAQRRVERLDNLIDIHGALFREDQKREVFNLVIEVLADRARDVSGEGPAAADAGNKYIPETPRAVKMTTSPYQILEPLYSP